MRGHGIAAVAPAFSASCAYTCFQTPEVIPPGHAAVGAGDLVRVGVGDD